MDSVLEFFDLFDKNNTEEMKSHTKSGPIISTVLMIFCSILFLAEFALYISPEIYRDLSVDPSFSNGQELVNISLSVVVDMPCYFLHLDTIDSLGFQELDVNSTVTFRRQARNGSIIGISHFTMKDICGACYGLTEQLGCCTCQQLFYFAQIQNKTATPELWAQCSNKTRPVIDPHEKCLIKGKLTVNKVKGNFHIAPGINTKNNPYSHAIGPEILSFPISHKIDRIRFGPHIPKTSNPLRNIKRMNKFPLVTYIYNCIVTPIKYIKGGKEIRRGYEYTVLQMTHTSLPMIIFDYSFTPYTIVVTMNQKSILTFISSSFGVMSGVFAIASIIEMLLPNEGPKYL